jgi:pyridoxal phosphate enzyme (YggS family)
MTISDRLQNIQQRIENAALACGRNPRDITLVGVTKGQPIDALIEAHHAGLTHFAENYWQEAQVKITELSHLPITWHFIGPIQSNKAALIANHVSWVHSVCREKIVSLLAAHRPAHLPPLNVCIQVSLDNEVNKSGVAPEAIYPLLTEIHQYPNLTLKGLMAIPEPRYNQEEQRESFERLSRLLTTINQHSETKLDTLSMGMSDDFVPAIQAGSTLLRIGQAIFGQRQGSSL